MLDRSEIGKRGYLNEPYRLFHLRDNRALALDYHYHEFDKLVLLLGGRATYHIEGRSYPLQPMDILLVSRNLIHLPEAEPGLDYERMVLWIDRDFMSRHSVPGSELSDCFTLTARRGVHLHRPRGEERSRWRARFEEVEAAAGDRGFAAPLLADTCKIPEFQIIIRSVRINDRLSSRQILTKLMMVCNNKLHTKSIDIFSFIHCRNTIVDSHNQISTLCLNLINGMHIHTIALAQAVRNIINNIRPKAFKQ